LTGEVLNRSAFAGWDRFLLGRQRKVKQIFGRGRKTDLRDPSWDPSLSIGGKKLVSRRSDCHEMVAGRKAGETSEGGNVSYESSGN